MYAPEETLEASLSRMIATAADRGSPVPSAATRLTVEDLKSHHRRFRAGHAALRAQLEAYDPEALIIIGGDQSEMFDHSNKVNMMIYTGEEAFGRKAGTTDGTIALKCHVDLSKFLLNELVEDGFDVAFSEKMVRLGSQRVPGLPHPFVNPMEILPRPDLPVVLVYENTYDPPALLSGSRCYELGQAIAKILGKDSRKVAIYGSGGLSHDLGTRRIWIDEPFDHWLLEQISQGTGYKLKDVYDIDSMTLDSGTGECRAWITVAGAMEQVGAKATVVDYVAAPETITGCGFAYWVPPRR